ncbi:MAG: DUF899 family protein [Gammaproteobacteria bacterium]
MAYTDTIQQLNDARRRILEIRAEMRELQADIDPEPVADYEFATVDGPVRLAQLFGDKNELILIHNMGSSCRYCTLWADGFNGLVDHLADRAAFVVTSPESPEEQRKFAVSRNWRFPMVSHEGTDFARDMGYYTDEGDFAGFHPGVSVFVRDGERVTRVSDAPLGPDDDFCNLWHLFNLLPEGPNGWAPQYKY